MNSNLGNLSGTCVWLYEKVFKLHSLKSLPPVAHLQYCFLMAKAKNVDLYFMYGT